MYWINIAGIALGAAAAVTCETLFRFHEGEYSQIYPAAIILALLANWGVWSTMKGSTSLMAALIVWTGFTQSFRVLSTIFILKESPHPGAWVGFGLIVLAQLANRLWR